MSLRTKNQNEGARFLKLTILAKLSAMAAAILKGSHDQEKVWGHHVTLRQKDILIQKERRQILPLKLEQTSGLYELIRQCYETKIDFKLIKRAGPLSLTINA